MKHSRKPTRQDVTSCYNLLLGREPESQKAVDWHVNTSNTVAEMISKIVRSDEFESRFGIFRTGTFMDAEKFEVEVESTPEQLSKLLDRTALTWNELGVDEPHWSVITDPSFKSESIEANQDAFYKTGEAEIGRLGALLQRNGLSFSKDATCIDFGCGVGRLSLPLSDRVNKVIGVDISNGHLTAARHAATKYDKPNASFVKIDAVSDLDNLPSCDLLVTLIVLQHNPPPVMLAILEKLLARLNPGGVAVFQVPVYRENYSFSIEEYLAKTRSLDMEMHPLPPSKVFKAISKAGCAVLEVREDLHAYMRDIVSQTFLVQKAAVKKRPSIWSPSYWLSSKT